MLTKNKFLKLNVKQQIHKLAFEVRGLEVSAESGTGGDPAALESYLEFCGGIEDQPKIAAAAAIVSKALPDYRAAPSTAEKVRVMNFCYHDLLNVIDETPAEQFYRMRRFDGKREVRRFDYAVVLDNLRSAFNVGSVFRTADSFGAGRLVLTGITPKPPAVKIERSSMGTTGAVEWKYFADAGEAVRELKSEGYKVYAVETASNSVPLESLGSFGRAAFVFGNEEFGMSDAVMRECDGVVEIPLAGIKNSINVASACAIVCYRAMTALAGD